MLIKFMSVSYAVSCDAISFLSFLHDLRTIALTANINDVCFLVL